jgi:WD40 repeat protein
MPTKCLLIILGLFACFLTKASVAYCQQPIFTLAFPSPIRTISRLPSDSQVAVACAKSSTSSASISLVNVNDGTIIKKLKGDFGDLAGFALISNKKVISADYSEHITITDVETGNRVGKVERNDKVVDLCHVSDAPLIATLEERRLCFFVVGDQSHTIRPEALFRLGICSRYKFSRDGTIAVTAANESMDWMPTEAAAKIEVRSSKNGSSLCAFNGRDSNNIVQLAISDDKELLAVGYFFGTTNLEIRLARNGQPVFVGGCGPELPASLALSPDKRHLVVGGASTGSLFIYDIERRLQSNRLGHAHRGAVRSLEFSADGTRLISGGADGRMNIWDWSDLKKAVGPDR